MDRHSAQSSWHIVTLLPSRKTVCESANPNEMDANFELKALALLPSGQEEMPLTGVAFSRVEPSKTKLGGTYRVENLQPGRKYKLKVRSCHSRNPPKIPSVVFTIFCSV